jgi:hypothetical protein
MKKWSGNSTLIKLQAAVLLIDFFCSTHIKHMHIESKFSNISKFIKIIAYIEYRIEIRYRNDQSNIVSKFEIASDSISKNFRYPHLQY